MDFDQIGIEGRQHLVRDNGVAIKVSCKDLYRVNRIFKRLFSPLLSRMRHTLTCAFQTFGKNQYICVAIFMVDFL